MGTTIWFRTVPMASLEELMKKLILLVGRKLPSLLPGTSIRRQAHLIFQSIQYPPILQDYHRRSFHGIVTGVYHQAFTLVSIFHMSIHVMFLTKAEPTYVR